MLLQVEKLTKSFGDTVVLKEVSFQVDKGEVVVIIGRSGCGKSTLLRCLNGLEQIDSGRIQLKEKEINTATKHYKYWSEIRKKIAMVFQSYDLFPHMNVLSNITLGPRRVEKRRKEEAEEDARVHLKRVGLLEKQYAYPRELSGGQKQRVAICRALCMHPELILFDEVTAALDPEMVREVLDVIKGLREQGMTMLIVTHEMAFAEKVADKIIFMEEGRIVEMNTAKEFFACPVSQEARSFLNIHDNYVI